MLIIQKFPLSFVILFGERSYTEQITTHDIDDGIITWRAKFIPIHIGRK